MTRPPAVLLLDAVQMPRVLTLEDCIEAVEAAFGAHHAERSLRPGLVHVDAPAGEFHIKCGGLRGKRAYLATKINGQFFGNAASSGLPNIMGTIVLNDADNGAPLAILESRHVTRLRTGAATAVAARHLARPASSTVTLCGAGAQAEVNLRALREVLPIERVLVWSRSGAAEFADRVGRDLGIRIEVAAELQAATAASDVVVTCTPARQWFLDAADIVPGTFVAAVGADSPGKHEVDPKLLASSRVVCDLVDQCTAVGELHHAVDAGLMGDRRPDELGAIINGAAPGRTSNGEVIVFDSTGTALQDAAAAAVAFENATRDGIGTAFELWP